MQNNFLITTALKDTWKTGPSVNYLGRWCIPYQEEIKFNKLKFNYHWDDRQKLKNDYRYLENFYEIVLKSLSNFLNEYHDIKKEINFWRIIIGPWLISLVGIIFDRYEILRIYYKNIQYVNTEIINLEEKKLIPFNWQGYQNILAVSDLWNHWIFGKLISHSYKNQTKILKKNLNNIQYSLLLDKNSLHKVSFFKRVLDTKFFFTKNKYFIYDQYLSVKDTINLNMKLGQFPTWGSQVDERYNINSSDVVNLDLRKKNKLNFETKNDFELFFKNNLLTFIPVIYFEDFKKYFEQLKKIPFNGKVIVTSGAHFSNDMFKIWCGEQVENKKKLLVSSHGGMIPQKYDIFDHDEKISYKKVVWHKPLNQQQIQLVPNKLTFEDYRRKNSKKILLTCYESQLLNYRCQSGPHSGQVIDDFNQKVEFINLIEKKFYSLLKIRPGPNRGWNTKKRFSDLFGSEIIDKEKSYLNSLKRTKISITTYPQTTFSESIAHNVPSICLLKEEYWDTEDTFKNYYQDLKKNKIIFSDPILAAKHLNEVYENIDEWWNSEAVKNLKEYFFKNIIKYEKDKTYDWVNYLKHIAN